jgi:hypothetical protein
MFKIMHLSIRIKDTGNEEYFIKNCKQTGLNDYEGDNIKLRGMKPRHWDFVWMLNEKDIAPLYQGIPVGCREDVNNITQNRISEKYSIQDEMKINRMKDSDFAQWEEYNNFVNQIVLEGKQFKDANFNG